MKSISLPLVVSFLAPLVASAHIGYTNRDFGSQVAGDPPVTITTQTVTGNFGWADGTDDDRCDSHKLRAYRFNVPVASHVTITFSGSTNGGLRDGSILPAFSVYQGLAHLSGGADHDGSAISAAYLAKTFGPAKEGCLESLRDWKIGSDAGVTFADLSSFTFVGYAADGTAANFGDTPGIVGDGNADGTVSGTFYLLPGDYSIFVGGANYSGQFPTPDATVYGLTGTVSAAAADATAPLATIVPVGPNPRMTAVDEVAIAFSEPVQNFDLSDLALTRDGGANLIDGTFTLVSTGPATFALKGAGTATTAAGTYQLALSTSDILDAAGNPLATGAATTWLTETELYTASQVQALHVGTPLLQRDAQSGLFTLTLGLEKSTALDGFLPLPITAPQLTVTPDGRVAFSFGSADPAAFFRVEAE